MAEQKRREPSVESLRGLAVILMVAGHVIGDSALSGLEVPDTSRWRFSYVALEDLRLPLFTLISGWVYALRPVVGRPTLAGFVQGKVRRLLVPFVVVGTAAFAVKVVLPATNDPAALDDFWRTYVYGFEHLWFLQAIFLIFMVVGPLDASQRLARPDRWARAFGIACAAHLLLRLPGGWNVLSINRAVELAPFFLLGYGLCRHARALEGRRVLAVASAVFAAAFTARLLSISGAGSTLADLPDRAVGLSVGMSGLLLLWSARRRIAHPALARLGAYSFGIYLLHVFGSAGSRIGLERAGVEANWLLFLAGLAAGVLAPVLVELTAGRHPVVSRLVFGVAPRPPREQPVERVPRWQLLSGGWERLVVWRGRT